MLQLRFIESMPAYRRMPFSRVSLTALGAGQASRIVSDDFLWMGIAGVSTSDLYKVKFYDEDRNEYIPAGDRFVYSETMIGTGQRPFYFPCPRLLRRNQTVKVFLEDLSGLPNDVQIVLIGLLVDKVVGETWGKPFMGYQSFTNDNLVWTIPAASYSVQQIPMIQAFDWAWGSLTGKVMSSGGTPGKLLEMKVNDPMGCSRDPSVTISGYPVDDEPVIYETAVGVATFPHWAFGPYPFLAEGQIVVEFTNLDPANDIDVNLVFHGGKLPRNDPSLMRRTIDWMNRAAVKAAR